ncbi:MAG: DMT family transporter, partial [bacterium]|nr:DMT family transporter [bacterium]
GAGLVAGAALFGGFFFQTMGLRWTTTANSAFLTTLFVVFVPLFLWLGGRKPRLWESLGALVAVLGLYTISGARFDEAGRGDALTLLCAVMFALHIRCLGKWGRRIEPVRFFAIQVSVAGALAVAAGLLWGGPVAWSGTLVLALAVTGILGTASGFFLQTWAQRRLAPIEVSLWLLTEPLFALVFGAILLGEFPGPGPALGACLILLGAFLALAGDSFAGCTSVPLYWGHRFFLRRGWWIRPAATGEENAQTERL